MLSGCQGVILTFRKLRNHAFLLPGVLPATEISISVRSKALPAREISISVLSNVLPACEISNSEMSKVLPAQEKNMPELMKIDPNARTVGGWCQTILHWCAEYAWVEGVKYLMSREPKPDTTIRDKYGGNEFSQICCGVCAESLFFEIKRFM